MTYKLMTLDDLEGS